MMAVCSFKVLRLRNCENSIKTQKTPIMRQDVQRPPTSEIPPNCVMKECIEIVNNPIHYEGLGIV
jgi:hypothetical protein